MSESAQPCPRDSMVPHLRDIKTWCRRRSGDFHLAEDITQDVALAALTKLPSLRDPLRIRPWLFRIAQRRLADAMRRRTAELPLLIDPPAPRIDRADERERRQLARIQRAIRRLPTFLRQPVRMHYLNGHALRDVAASLDTTVNGVKARLYRARHLLREEDWS